jgi:hypothetical protein
VESVDENSLKAEDSESARENQGQRFGPQALMGLKIQCWRRAVAAFLSSTTSLDVLDPSPDLIVEVRANNLPLKTWLRCRNRGDVASWILRLARQRG